MAAVAAILSVLEFIWNFRERTPSEYSGLLGESIPIGGRCRRPETGWTRLAPAGRSRELPAASQTLQEPVDGRDWQPHHVRPGAFDPVDESRRASLDAVGAGLGRGFAGGQVPLEL